MVRFCKPTSVFACISFLQITEMCVFVLCIDLCYLHINLELPLTYGCIKKEDSLVLQEIIRKFLINTRSVLNKLIKI